MTFTDEKLLRYSIEVGYSIPEGISYEGLEKTYARLVYEDVVNRDIAMDFTLKYDKEAR